MSIIACADLVERADPDRFKAAMLAPPDARAILLPLYAFNVEVSRAPWVTTEPMIAEMRLQWWRDALAEIAEGKAVRAHEVTTPLAAAIGPEEARHLDKLVEARRWDIYRDPFENDEGLLNYLDATSGALMCAAATALGAVQTHLPEITAYGRAVGLSRYLQAVPTLEARGRIPLVDGRPASIAALCQGVLETMPKRRVLGHTLGTRARTALIEGWQARAILKRVIADPTRVADGQAGLSEFGKRWRLLLA